MKKVKFFLFILFISTQLLAANAEQDLFSSANENYEAGDFKSAIEQYEELLEEGFQSAELHYNLGNSYFRLNDLGYAVLHLEKAALLAPRNKDIEYNLQVVRSNLPDQIEVISEFFVTRWWKNLQTMFGPRGWGIIGLIFLWAGIAGLVIWFRGSNRQLRKRGFVIGLSLLILSIFPFALGFSASKNIKNSKRAVITIAQIDLKSAPDEDSENILELHAGTSLSILDEIGDWKKIRLSNGEEGWLETAVLEKI